MYTVIAAAGCTPTHTHPRSTHVCVQHFLWVIFREQHFMALIKLPWQQPLSPPTALSLFLFGARGKAFTAFAQRAGQGREPELMVKREQGERKQVLFRREQNSQLRALFACQRGTTTIAPGPTKYLTQADCKDVAVTVCVPGESSFAWVCVRQCVCVCVRERAVARALQAMSS